MLYPAYKSYKALKSRASVEEQASLLKYFVTVASFELVEGGLDTLGYFIPFYSFFKLPFQLWLMTPSTQGAVTIYDNIIKPIFNKYEPTIELFSTASTEILNNLPVLICVGAANLMERLPSPLKLVAMKMDAIVYNVWTKAVSLYNMLPYKIVKSTSQATMIQNRSPSYIEEIGGDGNQNPGAVHGNVEPINESDKENDIIIISDDDDKPDVFKQVASSKTLKGVSHRKLFGSTTPSSSSRVTRASSSNSKKLH